MKTMKNQLILIRLLKKTMKFDNQRKIKVAVEEPRIRKEEKEREKKKQDRSEGRDRMCWRSLIKKS